MVKNHVSKWQSEFVGLEQLIIFSKLYHTTLYASDDSLCIVPWQDWLDTFQQILTIYKSLFLITSNQSET